MWEYFVQADGRVRQMSEAKLRAMLRKRKFKGLELARRADDPTWRPLGQLPLYAEEVPFEGDPLDHARQRTVRGFGVHFLVYLAVNLVAGFPLPLLVFWGIGIVTHGAKVYPHAKVLNDAGKLPLIGSWNSAPSKLGAAAPAPALPPRPVRGQTAPHAAIPSPHPAGVSSGGIAQPGAALPSSHQATLGSGETQQTPPVGGGDPMGFEPTIGIGAPASTDIEHQQLQASVRGKLFGADENPPMQIGRYQLGERLGAGGMGVVFRAHDTSLDRPVALKLLRPGYEMEAAAERLQREARAMARLSHPNVVTVFDVGTYEGSVFVAMEHVDGVTLRQWLGQPHSVGDVVGVMEQAARGLAAAHQAGLVHRDFKPENVMVGRDGRVRVLDFGLAKPTDQSATHDLLTQTGTLLGTPRYMAPEQFRGEPADARTDQFSLGVVFYEALWGTHPYQPTDDRPLPRAVMAGALRNTPNRADVPPAVRKAILTAISHLPEERHPTLSRFAESLGPRPTTSDALASLAAAARRLLERRAREEAMPILKALDGIEFTVAELDARTATLAGQLRVKEVDALEHELTDARRARDATEDDETRALLTSKAEALEQRLDGMRAAQDMLERLRTRRSVAETQLKQLHLDLVRSDAGDTALPDLTGPLQELRYQVDAAQEVEALLKS